VAHIIARAQGRPGAESSEAHENLGKSKELKALSLNKQWSRVTCGTSIQDF